jgi:hydrogenase-4 component F
MILLELLIALPFLGALASVFVPHLRGKLAMLVAVAGGHAVLTLFAVTSGDRYGEVFGIDEIGRMLLLLTSFVNLACSVAAVDYVRSGRRAKSDSYVPCHLAFLGALTMALCTLHLGVFWVAIEATTLATAPLIYNHRSRESLEATWKYLVLCSVGIALALLGTFCMAIALSGSKYPTPWDVLALPDMLAAARTGNVDLQWLRMAFVLALIGYGTKMGLAPMHSWMPDAYCESPSPAAAASSLLSNTAFLGILRMLRICDAAGESEFARKALIVLGLLSILTAAIFLHGQKDFKRLLAYSSIENMGLIALGVGLGSMGALGAAWLMVNHSVVKAMLFICAGSFVRTYDSHAVADIRHARSLVPVTSVMWILGVLAISGMPPFGVFPAKMMILFSGVQSGRYVITCIVILALSWIFLGMSRTALGMVFQMDRIDPNAPADSPPVPADLPHPRAESPWYLIPALCLAGTSVIMGIAMPTRFADNVRAAAVLTLKTNESPMNPVVDQTAIAASADTME